MAISRRQGVIFAAGLLLGAAVSALTVMGLRSYLVAGKPASMAPQKPQAGAPARPGSSAAAPQPAATAAAFRFNTECPLQPLVPAAAAGDGMVRLQDVSTRTAADVGSFITAGKEAAAAGNRRDAEVAFVMACRVADRFAQADGVAAADARYQLGRHYANVARSADAGRASRVELLRRAELLYADSLQAYAARHGRDHEKSRFAAEGLATVRQTLAQAGQPARPPVVAKQVAPAAAPAAAPTPAPPAAPAPAPEKEVAAKPVPPPKAVAAATPAPPRPRPAARPAQPRQAEVAVAEPQVRQATGSPVQVRPSFDCARARSPSEKAICSDAELARLDRDLGRLHARARNAAADGAAFRRQNDREWRRRESTCRGDRECLRQWYADRRDQLMDGVD